MHPQPGILRHRGHHRGFQVFPGSQFQEAAHIGSSHHHRHPLLGLRNGQLCAVQTVILLGHPVQINLQPIGQLTNGHRHAACTKVVAPLDHPGGFAVAEQTLKLPLFGSVALLHLCTAAFKRF